MDGTTLKDEQLVILTKQDHLGIITLNRPRLEEMEKPLIGAINGLALVRR